MQQVKTIFHDDDIDVSVMLPNGDKEDFHQVSAMLNWCAEKGYEPVLVKDGRKGVA